MRYFQLINPIRNQYPLVGEKEIYIEENGVQTLILKRNIIANFPNETMEIAHDLFLEDVQREQSYNSIKNTIEKSSFQRLGWIIDKFKDFKKDCYTNEQTDIIDNILYACRYQYKMFVLEQENLKNQSNEC